MRLSHPAAIRVFQRHGIDFCCGGKRQLREVCAQKEVSFPELKKELEAAVAPSGGEPRNWVEASQEGLVGHIVDRFPGELRTELPR